MSEFEFRPHVVQEIKFNLEKLHEKLEVNVKFDAIVQRLLAIGERLKPKAGKIEDLPGDKPGVTAEDIQIENEIAQLVSDFNDGSVLFSEEQFTDVPSPDAKDVWIMDPISNTKAFKEGRPGFAITIARRVEGKTNFSAVYDVARARMYTAYEGKGAFLNGQKINVPEDVENPPRVAVGTVNKKLAEQFGPNLVRTDRFSKVHSSPQSVALNTLEIVIGQREGSIILAKDFFPHPASQLIIQEAGGKFTNLEGSDDLAYTDEVFVAAANSDVHAQILKFVQDVAAQRNLIVPKNGEKRILGDEKATDFLNSINFKDFKVKKTTEGVSTDVYKLEKDGSVYFLRILSKGESASVQTNVHKILLERGVHVPQVENFEDDNEYLKSSYMIVKEIGGSSVEDQIDSGEGGDFDPVLFAAGQDLARINSVPVQGFGRIVDANGPDVLRGKFPNYEKAYLGDFDKMVDQLFAEGIIDEELKTLVMGLMSQNKDALCNQESVLTHGDLDLSHIFSDHGEYKGIIDFGDARGASPHYDLAYFRFRCGARALDKLIDGYKTVKPLGEDADIKIQLEGLVIAVKKLAWAFKKGKDGARFEKAKYMLERYIEEMTIKNPS